MQTQSLIVRSYLDLGPQPYQPVWQAMRQFTQQRSPETPDEIWLLEHQPVYTLGQAADTAHILDAGDIPVVKIDRGGQVTYHGPGQLMLYTLIDIARLNIGVRDLVVALEEAVIAFLSDNAISARGDRDAPGVYVDSKKIAALGLRISKGRAYHGLCLNIALDTQPFAGINPCGYEGMEVTQLADTMPEYRDVLNHKERCLGVAEKLAALVACQLNYGQANVHWHQPIALSTNE